MSPPSGSSPIEQQDGSSFSGGSSTAQQRRVPVVLLRSIQVRAAEGQPSEPNAKIPAAAEGWLEKAIQRIDERAQKYQAYVEQQQASAVALGEMSEDQVMAWPPAQRGEDVCGGVWPPPVNEGV